MLSNSPKSAFIVYPKFNHLSLLLLHLPGPSHHHLSLGLLLTPLLRYPCFNLCPLQSIQIQLPFCLKNCIGSLFLLSKSNVFSLSLKALHNMPQLPFYTYHLSRYSLPYSEWISCYFSNMLKVSL